MRYVRDVVVGLLVAATVAALLVAAYASLEAARFRAGTLQGLDPRPGLLFGTTGLVLYCAVSWKKVSGAAVAVAGLPFAALAALPLYVQQLPSIPMRVFQLAAGEAMYVVLGVLVASWVRKVIGRNDERARVPRSALQPSTSQAA